MYISEAYKALGKLMEETAEYLRRLKEALCDLIETAVDSEEEQETEEKEVDIPLIFSCKRFSAPRLDLVPWYTSGFE